MAFLSNTFVLILLASMTIIESRYHPEGVADIDDDYDGDEDYEEFHPKEDAFPSASNGRVKIQVFRGPTKSADDEEEEEWAPWGFYVSQPADHGFHGNAHGDDT